MKTNTTHWSWTSRSLFAFPPLHGISNGKDRHPPTIPKYNTVVIRGSGKELWQDVAVRLKHVEQSGMLVPRSVRLHWLIPHKPRQVRSPESLQISKFLGFQGLFGCQRCSQAGGILVRFYLSLFFYRRFCLRSVIWEDSMTWRIFFK